jgi:hypothetical protein
MQADFAVPLRPVKGLWDAPLGTDEGQQCLRSNDGAICLAVIEYRPDASLGGCWCPTGHPPCGYCTSVMPECPACGWRESE